MSKQCEQCGQPMACGTADIEETIRGVRVRMLSVPAWTCEGCGHRRVTLSVARYISQWLRHLLTGLPPCPDDLERPFVPTEIVFSSQ